MRAGFPDGDDHHATTKRMRQLYPLAFCLLAAVGVAHAGNPDRQGEAGAYELLLNPFARSAGLGSMTTANVAGVEALRINVAGIGRTNTTEVTLSNMQYLSGTDLNMNALGFAAALPKGQSIAVTIAALSFGDIARTTVNTPEGDGSTFSPTFFHIGLAYAKTFDEKISVGAGVRFISEAIFNASATGFAIDAGVQYVSGERDEFKLGISLRNVGLGMQFSGDGIAQQFDEPDDDRFLLTATQRVADFDLPFQLNIGTSYDIRLDPAGDNRLTLVGNFTSNAFSRDNIGAGFEYGFRNYVMLRAGYNYEVGVSADAVDRPLHSGISAGITGAIPLGNDSDRVDDQQRPRGARAVYVDYAYRTTNIFNGTHNIGLRLNL